MFHISPTDYINRTHQASTFSLLLEKKKAMSKQLGDIKG